MEKQEHRQSEDDIGHCRGDAGGELIQLAEDDTHGSHAPMEERRFVGHLAHTVERQRPVARLNHRIADYALTRLALGVVVTEAQKRDDRQHTNSQQQPKCLFGGHVDLMKRMFKRVVLLVFLEKRVIGHHHDGFLPLGLQDLLWDIFLIDHQAVGILTEPAVGHDEIAILA